MNHKGSPLMGYPHHPMMVSESSRIRCKVTPDMCGQVGPPLGAPELPRQHEQAPLQTTLQTAETPAAVTAQPEAQATELGAFP